VGVLCMYACMYGLTLTIKLSVSLSSRIGRQGQPTPTYVSLLPISGVITNVLLLLTLRGVNTSKIFVSSERANFNIAIVLNGVF
jgi:hypothetical protein